ncbi:hypothetical protein EXIGLDRAFT_760602 [Exidia glandulosa HHB12029]|uniref:Uncharacterized protein n=1 Tax=Exidia glandulosa HHB12029 TaxID=1314781 RepID=A0A165P5T6_EXIGL|nr:hypothetical protein EXIGLDRAFT_760602 [Exidia glandulosa HHB12029]
MSTSTPLRAGDDSASSSELDTFYGFGCVASKQAAVSNAQPYVLRGSGSWSRNEFARHVLNLSEQSNDEALAYIMNSFPPICPGRAKLWLAYLKDASARGVQFDAYIMDTFRQIDWCRIVLSDVAAELVPELLRLLPHVSIEGCAECPTHVSAAAESTPTMPSYHAAEFGAADQALEDLYAQV